MSKDVLSVFLKDPQEQSEPVKALSVRMPMSTYTYLQRLASAADLSGNAMAVLLLQWGIEFALTQLPADLHVSISREVEGDQAAEDAAIDRMEFAVVAPDQSAP
jgi:hypothetical protein